MNIFALRINAMAVTGTAQNLKPYWWQSFAALILLLAAAATQVQAGAEHDHDAQTLPAKAFEQTTEYDHAEVHAHGDVDDHGNEHAGAEDEENSDHLDEHDEAGHGHGGGSDSHDDHEEAAVIEMSAEQQQMAGVGVETLTAAVNALQIIKAPGELVNDQYNTTLISAQLAARVVERQAVLGQKVKVGQPLVTLFSVEMAEIQGQYKLAEHEWLRVKQLGQGTVGAKRYNASLVSYQQSRAQVLAAGLTEAQLTQLRADDSELGRFSITAPHAGVVLADNFQTGQWLAAGQALLTLVDESSLWVEAKLSPRLGQRIPAGTRAQVEVAGQQFPAHVIQEIHAINEQTRTRNVRLKIDNRDHLLHPGLFAEVRLLLPVKARAQSPLILLPEAALMRGADGDWTVFVEIEAGKFTAREVELQSRVGELYQVSGVKPGERVATAGAFFIASEFAKGGFDPHNH